MSPTLAPATRVLLVCDRLDLRGGVERFVCTLAAHLAAEGMAVGVATVATARAAVAYHLPDGVEVLSGSVPAPSPGGPRGWRLLRAQWHAGGALADTIGQFRPEVVVLNGVVTACAVLLRRPGVAPRCIACDHNHFDARSALWRRLRAHFYPRLAAVVSLTTADRSRFAALNAHTVVIPNASALGPFAISTTASPGGGGNGMVVLACGRLVDQKGIDLLLRAWTSVQRAAPSARLHIVGDGPLHDKLQALARDLGVAHSTVWLPATDDIARHYHSADVFVLPSRYEGMPLSLLEAQALGLPSVAFDCPTGPADILTPATGVLVPPLDVPALAEALLRLLADAPLRARMGAAAAERSRSLFSLELHLRRWTELVRQVAAALRGNGEHAGGEHGVTSVCVIVPCRNERAHIASFCSNVLRQCVPADVRLQLLVADGLSDDGTRETLQVLATADRRIVVLDNPARIAAAGLNLALAAADGEVIVRMDVHTRYADDYIAQCVAVLAETGADNVGGAWCAVPPANAAPMQRAIAAAFQSRWVAGGARSRQSDWDGWVDTVYLGCWPRATFDRWGGFDEALVRNQDDEHNLRLRRGGGRIWQSARIHSAYQPRARWRQVVRQYLQYGYWKPFVMRKHGQAASWRQLLPSVLVLGASGSAVLALVGGWRTAAAVWPLAAWIGGYAVAVVAMACAVAVEQRPAPATLLRVPAVIVAYHVAYGVGSLLGWWDVLRRGTAPGRSGLGALSR